MPVADTKRPRCRETETISFIPVVALISTFAWHQAAPDADPRGPVPFYQGGRELKPVVALGRVEAASSFRPVAYPLYPGGAKWIWLNSARSSGDPPVAALFRKTVDLDAAPRLARIWFSADAHARIYVNGRLAARGPDDGGQDYPGTQTGHWFADYRDLTPLFHRGRNVIAAEVFTASAMEGRYNTTGQGGFLFKAELYPAGRPRMTIDSDASWRGVPGPEWSFTDFKPGENPLTFDGTAETVGWREAAFDDRGWPICSEIPSKWPSVETSEIPARLEATYPIEGMQRPTAMVTTEGDRITFRGDGSVAVHYDRVLSGFIGLKVRGAAGTVLAIQPNEPDEPGYHRMAAVRLREGVQTFELPFYDSFSVVNLVASHVSRPLEILDFRANFVAQPVRYEGSFSCSDRGLNRIWNVCRWLTEICQQTHHLDSPHHQEPICDPGDYLIISLNNDYAFGAPALARQDLRKYGWLLHATRFHPFHTSYALLWLQMLIAYEDYTGDKSLTRELAPTVFDLLDQFLSYRGRNGLISEAPDYMFMDWVTIGGFGAHHPPAVIGQGYMTAFFYRALADGIRVASGVGDSARAERYRQVRDEIRTAYNRELWDDAAGLYRDGKPFVTSVKPGDWLPADKDIETHSTQNNVLAVSYDLAPETRHKEILRHLLSGNLNVQPYFMHFVFEAVEHAALFDEFGTSLLRRWKIDPNTQSFREMWDTGDYSHGWQCTPLFQMSARVLGITPTSPGFATVRIRPRLCDLTWAKGAVPTPHGVVHAGWRRTPSKLTVTVSLPSGCTGMLELPILAEDATLIVDGKSQPIKRVGDRIALPLTGGSHLAVLTLPTTLRQSSSAAPRR